MTTRDELINYLIEKSQAKSYLEIGICDGTNHKKIKCLSKVGIDPVSSSNCVTHRVTSDSFFAKNKSNFDVIFVDGLHVNDQVYRDITNSLKFLNKNGFIVCHDMNPPSELHQRVPRPKNQRQWNGDCWKAWTKLRTERSDISMYVVDIDWGCGVIKYGKQELFEVKNETLDYSFLEKNRNKLLNLVTAEEFVSLNL